MCQVRGVRSLTDEEEILGIEYLLIRNQMNSRQYQMKDFLNEKK